MKAKSIILAAIFTLSSLNVLFAKDNSVLIPAMNATEILTLKVLAPITPAEASFEDVISGMDFSNLAPVTPVEAAFEDVVSEIPNFSDLAPVTPAVASFSDFDDAVTLRIDLLAPASPMVADFE